VRPFTQKELASIGDPSVFVPAVWDAMHVQRDKKTEVWAIPWLADVWLIYYWRDMLEEAGIDEETAFQTPERLEETMRRLQGSSAETPWGWRATTTATTLQCASSWIWEAGGEYVSTDGKDILFNQPEAVQGLVNYVKLHRYMPPGVERQAATVVGTPGWFSSIYEQSTISDAPDRLGIAAPPGPAFVGGSGPMIWQHSHKTSEAVDLIRCLTGQQTKMDYFARMQQLPARLDVMEEPPYSTDSHYQVMTKALRGGRTYPAIPKWGALEKRLLDNVIANPDQDLEALVRPHMDALAQRLRVVVGT